METTLIWLGLVAIILTTAILLIRHAMHQGSTAMERTAAMTGDAYLANTSGAAVAMTRATSIDAPPDTVWPWLAQLGRGAGWYSIDRLDNGGIESARHIVSWIPAPRIGDASAIGYLRDVTPGRSLTWWVPGVAFLGALCSLVVDIDLRADGSGSRLVIRMSSAATGAMAHPALWGFRVIDSIMACRQISQIKKRVERYGARSADPARPETGARDQFQRYEVVYASGERAGTPGSEHAPRWRRAAIEAGVLGATSPTSPARP